MIINQDGRRIFIVGDIHGELSKLKSALDSLEFRLGEDILISVGDLIDRGPENLETLDWFFTQPLVYAVRGNHDDFMVAALDFDTPEYKIHWEHSPAERIWVVNGGGWIKNLSWETIVRYATSINKNLPFYIEIKLDCGDKFAVVHAESPNKDWNIVKERLAFNDRKIQQHCIWGRTVISQYLNHGLFSFVENIDFIFHGHTVVETPLIVGNQVFLDTGAVFGSRPLSFAIVEKSGNFSIHSVGADNVPICV